MKRYKPDSPPTVSEVSQVIENVWRELGRISDTLNQIHDHDELHADLSKVKDGMIRYFDGTDYDPGSGEGFYGRENGSWVKL